MDNEDYISELMGRKDAFTLIKKMMDDSILRMQYWDVFKELKTKGETRDESDQENM